MRNNNSSLAVGILGVGASLPKNVITNLDLQKKLDTSDEWIVSRTGIRERRILTKDQSLLEIVKESADLAILDASIKSHEIDLVIVATSTPDDVMPSCASYLQNAIGCTQAASFDIRAACAGFIYGIEVCCSMIKCGLARTALLVGADAMSRLVDWSDRRICVLFGDGAGAAVIGLSTRIDFGHIYGKLEGDGSLIDILKTKQNNNNDPRLFMDGQAVFKHAVRSQAECIISALKEADINKEDVSLFILHQANMRIVSAVAKIIGVSSDKFPSNVERVANTSAASIPILLNEHKKSLNPGDIVVLCAIGAGMVWGVSIIRW